MKTKILFFAILTTIAFTSCNNGEIKINKRVEKTFSLFQEDFNKINLDTCYQKEYNMRGTLIEFDFEDTNLSINITHRGEHLSIGHWGDYDGGIYDILNYIEREISILIKGKKPHEFHTRLDEDMHLITSWDGQRPTFRLVMQEPE